MYSHTIFLMEQQRGGVLDVIHLIRLRRMNAVLFCRCSSKTRKWLVFLCVDFVCIHRAVVGGSEGYLKRQSGDED